MTAFPPGRRSTGSWIPVRFRSWSLVRWSAIAAICLASLLGAYGLTWFAVLLGQGHSPRDYNPLIEVYGREDNLAYLGRIKDAVRTASAKMREHGSFLPM